MKAKRFSVIVVSVLILVLVSIVPASARAERVYYTGYTCPVYVGPPERMWISEDNVLHMRGVYTDNILTSTSPYLDGTAVIIMNEDVDLNTGNVHAFGNLVITPATIAGTWVGNFSTHVTGGVVRGTGTGHGTGALEGMIDFNQMSSPDVYLPECNNINTNSSGYVLIP
jgi:hypothetical protein